MCSVATSVFTDNFDPDKLEKKLGDKKYYVPPTMQDMHELREADQLFKSNLLRLQFDELIKETTIPGDLHDQCMEFGAKVQKWLGLLEVREQVNEASPNPAYLPKFCRSKFTAKTFKFIPPCKSKLVGSFNYNTCMWMGPDKPLTIDISITMPGKVFVKNDFVNMRYFVRRALYLEEVTNQLMDKYGDQIKVKLTSLCGDYRKCSVLLYMKGEARYRVQLFAGVEEGTFKLERFHTDKSSLRRHWYDNIPLQTDCTDNMIPSPRTNSSVLVDLLIEKLNDSIKSDFSQCQNVCLAVRLLKIWLYKRYLNTGYGGLSNFMITYLTYSLLCKKRINAKMSAYQIFRTILAYIDAVDNLKISTAGGDKTSPGHKWTNTLEDSNGDLNICYSMSSAIFKRVKMEAKHSLGLFDRGNKFDSVFIKNRTDSDMFDAMMSFEIDSKTVGDIALADYGNVEYLRQMNTLPELLSRVMANRIELCQPCLQHCEWSLSHNAVPIPNTIKLGFMFSDQFASRVDKGPAIGSEKVEEFKKFWCGKSDTRKFNDGSVHEAVLWHATNNSCKFHIWVEIVKFVVENHVQSLKLNSYLCEQLDHFVSIDGVNIDQKNDLTRDIITKSNSLSEHLHSLTDLPLAVQSVWTAFSEQVRGTDPACVHAISPTNPNSIPVMCRIEGSGKWPQDLQAIKRLKMAYAIRLCQSLRKTGLFSKTSVWTGQTTVLVLFNELVYRINLFADAEELFGSDQSPEKRCLKKRMEVASLIFGMQFQYPMWSIAVCLCKKWLSANFLLDGWGEILVELICSYIFHDDYYVRTPRTALCAFKRILRTFCDHNWREEPLFVSFDQPVPEDKLVLSSKQFKESGNDNILVVVKLNDEHEYLEYNDTVSKLTAYRTKVLAEWTLAQLNAMVDHIDTGVVNAKLKKIFCPSFDFCDVVMEIEQSLVRNATAGPSRSKTTFHSVDFDPGQLALKALNDSYGTYATFVYDKYTGTHIGAIWNKQGNMDDVELSNMKAAVIGGRCVATAAKPVKVCVGGGKRRKMLEEEEADGKYSDRLECDAAQMLEQWKILGLGVISGVHVKAK